MNTSIPCPEPKEPESLPLLYAILFGIPACAIIIVTVIGNFLVLCFKSAFGKKQTALLVWNLGLADFLVGIFVLPTGVAYVIGGKWPFPRWVCKIWTAADVVFCTASIVTLCVISVDRYIGVTRPLRYKIIVTKHRIVIAIACIWFFASGILLTTVDYRSEPGCINQYTCRVVDELRYVVHSVITAFFIPAVVTLLLYWKIYRIASERERCLKEGLMITMGDNFFTTCVVNEPMRIHCGRQRRVSKQRKVIKMHKLVAKTLGVVVSAFVVCWLPFFVVYLIGYHCNCVDAIVPDILSWLGYCNSMLNPIIYAFTMRDFKASVRRTLSFWKSHVHNGHNEHINIIRSYEPNNLAKFAHKRYSAVAAALLEAGLVGPVIDPVWSAKAYTVLISPHSTHL